MCRIIYRLIYTATFLISSIALANPWGDASKPSNQPSESVGFYTSGCLAGGEALPLIGIGYQVMRPDRNRYYGHPDLIELIHQLGLYAAQRNARLLVGDLSQPRGGPMTYGHKSHQIGLDADIWLQHIPSDQQLSLRQSEQRKMRSVVNKSTGNIINKHWSPLYRDILQAAAEISQVERIFVNPVIKRKLCQQDENAAWLYKIRPWWGHDAHFHVRLSCPMESSECRAQKPPPKHSGCDHHLIQWIEEQRQVVRKAPRPTQSTKSMPAKKPTDLPMQCNSLLKSH